MKYHFLTSDNGSVLIFLTMITVCLLLADNAWAGVGLTITHMLFASWYHARARRDRQPHQDEINELKKSAGDHWKKN